MVISNRHIDVVLSRIRKRVKTLNVPVVTLMAINDWDSFKILIATVLSLRTKDEVTGAASRRLFSLANDVYTMSRLSEKTIEKTIYPVGFFRQKAKFIKEICAILIDRFNGKVPKRMEDLLSLPGVGRKTANLVLAKGFGKYAICVDTHVHRICNRWGYVYTKNPDETEAILRQKLPKRHWISINDLLVAYGQGICVPVSPFCSKCVVKEFCPKVGVKKSR